MPHPRPAAAVFEREFLETRSMILNLAAALDRLDRAPEPLPDSSDPRLGQIRHALEVLLESGTDRAERVQRIFSDEYDPNWREGNGTAESRF